MAFLPLSSLDALPEGGLKPVEVDGERLLLVRHRDAVYLIQNRCGHFGVPLEDGAVADGRIRCKVHGFEFDLATGRALNAEREDCDPLAVYPVVIRDGHVGVVR